MIHQYIFAGPRPGLTSEAFQQYWLNYHAPGYAAKIPQILQYLVAPRVDAGEPCPAPFFQGTAELWLRNPAEQLASLQSQEFLQGARADEPRWAAFWQTFVHESFTDDESPPRRTRPPYYKCYNFLKRKPGFSLEMFLQDMKGRQKELAERLPGLQDCVLSAARSDAYDFGEPRFDIIEVWSFDSRMDLSNALQGEAMRRVEEGRASIADERYLFRFCGREHWIIYPGDR